MALVSYCDNANCKHNENFHCTYEEGITLDKNATCINATYAGKDKKKPKKDTDNKKTKEELEVFQKKDDDWFKVI